MFELLSSYHHRAAENQNHSPPPAQKPPRSCTKNTVIFPWLQRSSLPDLVVWVGFFFVCLFAFYIAISIQCMATDKETYQLLSAPWPEWKHAITSVQILHLIWKHSTEGNGARSSCSMKRTNKSAIPSFCLVQTQ